MVEDEELKVEVARLRRLEGFRRDPLGFVRWAFRWDSEGGDNAGGLGRSDPSAS